MRRKAKRNWFSQNIFCLEAWYKYISFYGESHNRTFIIMLVVIFICSFVISFDTSLLQLPTFTSQESNLALLFSFINKYFTCFKYNFYYMIHPAESTFHDKLTIVAFVTAVERIIILIISTFYLLALRRRFKRN